MADTALDYYLMRPRFFREDDFGIDVRWRTDQTPEISESSIVGHCIEVGQKVAAVLQGYCRPATLLTFRYFGTTK
ncbi:MAG: hypothetical protein U5S82_18830 [Gammaproteobacteria bacterium]|nr:hypothetical protein [Gammaproteobacteria bacterium]